MIQNSRDCLLHHFERNWALFTSFQKTSEEFLTIKIFATAIALDDEFFEMLNFFVGRKAMGALQTFAAAADAIAFFGKARINDFVVNRITFRAQHGVSRRKKHEDLTQYFVPSRKKLKFTGMEAEEIHSDRSDDGK